MDNKKIIKKITKIFAIYGIQIWLILFIVNVGVISLVRFKATAQSCMTQDQINADSRCLYILSGNIYKQGSRSSPHKGHPCGMDVTSIIPDFHTSNINKYLLPNFVAPLCIQPSPTNSPSPVPTQQPTQPPNQAPTSSPTALPTQPPTFIPASASSTQSPATAYPQTQAPSPTTLETPHATVSPTGTSSPTDVDIGNFSKKSTDFSKPSNSITNTSSPEQNSIEVNKKYNFIYWTTILSYISFGLLLITGGYWLIQKIKAYKKTQSSFPTNP